MYSLSFFVFMFFVSITYTHAYYTSYEGSNLYVCVGVLIKLFYADISMHILNYS